MIDVEFNISKKKMSLEMSGHAGSGDVGHDLVCACASILAYTAAQMAKEFEVRKQLRSKPLTELSEGQARVFVRPKEKDADEVWHMFNTIQTGFILLEKNYPDNVRIIRK